ncbi:MAG: Coenzyme F420 hydrogenase/dehydrogenase, beta subunit C-terminal domain [Loktanella sp.]|nr:Coenzyme F420 hydrogenase/dehydrogenase, beta subunit C-terminal domain [Loktanella sp.]
MLPSGKFQAIVDQHLCTNCGLCADILGPEKVQMVISDQKELRPLATASFQSEDLDLVAQICPGLRIEGPDDALAEEPDTQTDLVWGHYKTIVRAHAGNPVHRWEGSTGGVLTGLAAMMLETGRIRFVLHVRASDVHPTFGEATLSFTEADVLRAAGSRYGPTAPMLKLTDALDLGMPFAFIARPCDLSALANLSERDPRIGELIRYRLAFVCGGPTVSLDIDRMIEKAGVDPEDLVAMRYRGRGCPGPTTMVTGDGTVTHRSYVDFLDPDGGTWPMPFRCKICPDGIGELADIAVSDTWIGGGPDQQTENTDPGNNALIVRTAAGLELVEAAERAGFLTLGDTIGPNDLNVYQPHQHDKKFAAWARLDGLRRSGRLFPKTRRLRLKKLAAKMPLDFNESQASGARSRAEALVPEILEPKAASRFGKQPSTNACRRCAEARN